MNQTSIIDSRALMLLLANFDCLLSMTTQKRLSNNSSLQTREKNQLKTMKV
jgi:hypothetical protein